MITLPHHDDLHMVPVVLDQQPNLCRENKTEGQSSVFVWQSFSALVAVLFNAIGRIGMGSAPTMT